MIRLALLEILLFASPFILFALWRLSMQATQEVAEHKPAPTLVLSAVGGLLAAAGFVALVLTADSGDSAHTTYVPPRLGEGGIERAQFNNNPGEAAPRDRRIFAQPETGDDDATPDEDGDEDGDDGGAPQPR